MILINRGSKYIEEQHVDTLAEFLGSCFGVILTRRGREDPHICFQIVVEDDGNWFVSETSGDSYWLTELHEQMGRAIEWCKNHAEPDKRDIGWKVRDLTNRQ